MTLGSQVLLPSDHRQDEKQQKNLDVRSSRNVEGIFRRRRRRDHEQEEIARIKLVESERSRFLAPARDHVVGERGEFSVQQEGYFRRSERSGRSLFFGRNETVSLAGHGASEHPQIATTQWSRISMAAFQVPLKTSQCTFSKVNGRPFVRGGLILFPLFSQPRVCRYEQLLCSWQRSRENCSLKHF